MTTPLISNFRSIVDRYDALLCDAWGVIHNGVTLVPGIAAALENFRKERGPVIILTNAPRPSSIIPKQLDKLGLPRACYDDIVTSGDATRHSIQEHAGKPLYRLGPDHDDPLYEGLNLEFAPLKDAAAIVCTGLFNDDKDHPDDYRDMLGDAVEQGLPMICANPDIMVNWGGRMSYCAGALAVLYASLGGEVIYGGKPHAPIYELAHHRLAEVKAGAVPERVLAVGDGIATDIAGANANNLDAVFIAGAGGVYAGGVSERDINKTLAKAGVRAVAAMETLQW